MFLVVSLFAGSAEAQEPWWQAAESADDRFVTVELTPLYFGKAPPPRHVGRHHRHPAATRAALRPR
ncbi:MAG: hypothetical protein AAF514_10755, partial [Verrucomicrobiota bacterium]